MPELPLTPIERYFYHDHRASHPAWIRSEYLFAGTFSREAFTRAWTKMAERHPLAAATVACRGLGRPVWQLRSAQPELLWHDGPPAPGEIAGLHGLSRKSGVRGTISVWPGQVSVVLDVHHAVADGLAILFLVEDLFCLYARECGQTVALPAVAALDRRRGAAPLKASVWWRQLPWVLVGVAWGMLLPWKRTLRLAGVGGGNAARELKGREFSPGDTVRLRKAAKAAGANLNELLVRDTQAALGEWLKRHQADAPPQEWTRILVPFFTGGIRTNARCFANALGVGLIERRVRSLGRRPRLLQRAHEDMEFIRTRGLAHSFRWWMGALGCIPGGIVRYCRRPVARNTLVFSNLGNVFKTGPLVRGDGTLVVPGAEMTGFSGWGPCRPGSGMFVVTGAYRGRQTYWLSFDSSTLSEREANDFADELVKHTTLSLNGQ